MTLASFALRRCRGDRCTLCTRPRLGLICIAWPRRSSRLRARKLSRSCVMTCPPPTPSTGALPFLRSVTRNYLVSHGDAYATTSMGSVCVEFWYIQGNSQAKQISTRSACLNVPRQDLSWQTRCRTFQTTGESFGA